MTRTQPIANSPGRRTQAGAALLIIVVLLVVGASYAAIAGINAATADVKLRRETTNTAVLRQAKEALIAWSAMHASQGPGHLPCPDRDNDGDSEGAACGAFDTRIGRLPWRSLGLPDLRDASGERLWYVVSDNFVNKSGRPVNGDTPGTLQVVGAAPASNVVAIIIAPGAIVAKGNGTLQSRPGVAPCAAFTDPMCLAENFLERENADAANDVYVAAQRCTQNEWGCGSGFNDELIVVTAEDLFAIVEPLVARRIEIEVGKELRDYAAAWAAATGDAFYPFAAPFDAVPAAIPVGNGPVTDQKPYQSQFLGRIGQTNGLLPMSANNEHDLSDPYSTTSVRWTGAPTQTSSDPTRIVSYDCSFPVGVLDASQASCRLTYSAGSAFSVTLTGSVRDITKAFFLPIDPATVRADPPAATTTTLAQSIDPATGRLDVTATFNFAASGSGDTVDLIIPTPQPARLAIHPDLNWFRNNYWYSQVYYAFHPRFGSFVSPKPLAAASNSCASAVPGPATPCITLQTGSGIQNDIAAVAVLAGRDRTNAAPRPWDLARYYEGQNLLLSPATAIVDPANPAEVDYAFESRLRSPAFNDRTAVLARRP